MTIPFSDKPPGRTGAWSGHAVVLGAVLTAGTILMPAVRADTGQAIAAFDRKDYGSAWREFMAAAKQGDAEAEAGVGAMLFQKLNPPGTGFYYQCEQWLKASAAQGNAKGMTYLGLFYFADGRRMNGGINPGVNDYAAPGRRQAGEGRFVQARELFEKASALGDGYAMSNLAIMLDAGVGGAADPARAARLRSSVAAHSDKAFAERSTKDTAKLAWTAQWHAGHYAQALQAAEAGAAKGDAQAEALLGRAYYEGVGVQRNYATALRWLNLAVAKDNPDAIFLLGLMYEHGRGVPQDIPRSLQLFDQAAARGQGYGRMEAAGLRMQAESDRVVAMMHRNSGSEDSACRVAGGISTPGACIKGGENIDPWNFYSGNESAGGGSAEPSE